MSDRVIAALVVIAAFLVIVAWDLWRTWRARCVVCGAEHALYPERRCYSCHAGGRR